MQSSDVVMRVRWIQGHLVGTPHWHFWESEIVSNNRLDVVKASDAVKSGLVDYEFSGFVWAERGTLSDPTCIIPASEKGWPPMWLSLKEIDDIPTIELVADKLAELVESTIGGFSTMKVMESKRSGLIVYGNPNIPAPKSLIWY